MWTAQNQSDAEAILANFEQEYQTAVAAWSNSVQAGSASAQGQAAAEDVLRRWRGALEKLRDQSKVSQMGEGGSLDMLHTLVGELNEQKAVLASLQSRHGTASEQAGSLNPKVRSSPYTNILWLDRVFKPSTRMNIIIASIVFAILALGLMGWLIYGMITIPSVQLASYVPGTQAGGRRG